MGFVLQNLKWDKTSLAGGGGKEVYYLILMAERYSLSLHGKEVWSYGELPVPMEDPLSEVCH
jgi:hypothetical protein